METKSKSIRISEKVHNKLKVYVAKNKVSIIEFGDWAITTAMKDYELLKAFGEYREEFHSIMNGGNKPLPKAIKRTINRKIN